MSIIVPIQLEFKCEENCRVGVIEFRIRFDCESTLQLHRSTSFREIVAKIIQPRYPTWEFLPAQEANEITLTKEHQSSNDDAKCECVHISVSASLMQVHCMSESILSTMGFSEKPCMFYFRNPKSCRFGSRCHFSHDESQRAEALKLPPPRVRKCKFYLNTGCHNGKDCPMSHQGVPGRSRLRPVCRFFKAGQCRMEKWCEYTHDKPRYYGWKGM